MWEKSTKDIVFRIFLVHKIKIELKHVAIVYMSVFRCFSTIMVHKLNTKCLGECQLGFNFPSAPGNLFKIPQSSPYHEFRCILIIFSFPFIFGSWGIILQNKKQNTVSKICKALKNYVNVNVFLLELIILDQYPFKYIIIGINL